MSDNKLLKVVKTAIDNDNRLDDDGAAKLLGIKKRTLFNRVSGGKYSDLYTISPITGKRFWFKDKLMGSA